MKSTFKNTYSTRLSVEDIERLIMSEDIDGLIACYPDSEEPYGDNSPIAQDYVLEMWRESDVPTLGEFQAEALDSIGVSPEAILRFLDGFNEPEEAETNITQAYYARCKRAMDQHPTPESVLERDYNSLGEADRDGYSLEDYLEDSSESLLDAYQALNHAREVVEAYESELPHHIDTPDRADAQSAFDRVF